MVTWHLILVVIIASIVGVKTDGPPFNPTSCASGGPVASYLYNAALQQRDLYILNNCALYLSTIDDKRDLEQLRVARNSQAELRIIENCFDYFTNSYRRVTACQRVITSQGLGQFTCNHALMDKRV